MTQSKLFRHIFLCSFEDGVSPEIVNEIGAAFVALPNQIEEIVDLEWGSAANESGQYSHCLLVTVRDGADLQAYSDHPAHQAIGNRFGKFFGNYSIFDYWTK